MKESILVKILRFSIRRESVFYPSITMHFYAYTQFVSLFEDIFIDHLYYHPILRTKNVRIAVGGAHMGMFTAYCHWLNASARVYSFEADPVTFSLLRANAKENKWRNTTCINAALAGKTGTAWFYYDSQFPGSFVSSLSKERGLGGKKRVPTVRLSSYYHKKPFDYVKLDIEGAEYAVLRDLVRSKQLGKTALFIIEFHHNVQNMKELFSSALMDLTRFGFTYSVASEKPRRLFRYQDVMVYAEKQSVLRA